MKRMVLILIGILIFPQIAKAVETGTVSRIYPHNGKVYFRLKNDPCKNASANKYWYFELDSEVSKLWFSMLLTASSTKTVIKLGIPSCEPDKNQRINYIYQDF